jgi:predicted dehydrogenase
VFCEKPLGRTLDDARRIGDAAVDGFVAVGFCHRFQPEIVALKELIDVGRLGEIRSFRNRFSARLAAVESRWFSDPALSGGGVLMDTSVHSVDLFRHLVGEPVSVRALASTWQSGEGAALTVEDTAAMTVMTASGAVGVIDASWRTPAGTAIVEVEGTEGSAVADYSAHRLRVNIGGSGWQDAPLVEQNRFAAQARDVLEALRDRRPPRAGFRDGLRANEILDAAYRSIAAD